MTLHVDPECLVDLSSARAPAPPSAPPARRSTVAVLREITGAVVELVGTHRLVPPSEVIACEDHASLYFGWTANLADLVAWSEQLDARPGHTWIAIERAGATGLLCTGELRGITVHLHVVTTALMLPALPEDADIRAAADVERHVVAGPEVTA